MPERLRPEELTPHAAAEQLRPAFHAVLAAMPPAPSLLAWQTSRLKALLRDRFDELWRGSGEEVMVENLGPGWSSAARNEATEVCRKVGAELLERLTELEIDEASRTHLRRRIQAAFDRHHSRPASTHGHT